MKIVIGKTIDDLCPVAALLAYLNVRRSHPGPLFQWKSGTPLTKTKFVEELWKQLTSQLRTSLGQAIVLESEQPPLHQQVSLILLYRLLGDGRAPLIFFTSEWNHIS